MILKVTSNIRSHGLHNERDVLFTGISIISPIFSLFGFRLRSFLVISYFPRVHQPSLVFCCGNNLSFYLLAVQFL